jgi:hypothetical protein
MARPTKYASEEDKPVSVTLRFPRDLYDQAQEYAKRRQTTLTELVREGLQMRLETPTDPRDILVSQDITVMQELRQMIAEEVQTALAAQHFQTPEATSARQGEDNSKTRHYSNTAMQMSEDNTGSPVEKSTLAPIPAPETVAPELTRPRKGGRPRSAEGQHILDLLADHPEGLSAQEMRVYLKAEKPLGDTLAGMRRLGTVRTQGQGRETRYFAVQ